MKREDSIAKTENGIVGLAIGDALGTPVEFVKRQALMENPIREMIGYKSHNVPKGCWSDDTSMTLATIDSIIKSKKIDTYSMADNFIKWFRKAEYTATGKVFDIGRTTIQALAKYELKVCEPLQCGEEGEYSNGNGSLMRILPIAYYCFAKNLKEDEIIRIVREVSSITHRHEVSILGCYIYVRFAIELLRGSSIKIAYSKIKKIDYSMFSNNAKSKYKRLLMEDISKYELDEINSTSYIVDTLEAVIWVLLNTKNFNEAIIGAINLGDDTDTVGACTGGLAGIYYGIDSIKAEWKHDLLKFDYLIELCRRFDKVLNYKIL